MTKEEQNETVERYMTALERGPHEMAELMAIPYDSFKDLRSGRRRLRDIHVRLLDCLVALNGTKAGAEFGLRTRPRRKAA